MTPTVNTPDPRTAARADTALPGVDVQAVIDGIVADIAPIFAAMDWAEEEIAAASRRHPGQADAMYHAFKVPLPREVGPGMGTDFVYRGHAGPLPTPPLIPPTFARDAPAELFRPSVPRFGVLGPALVQEAPMPHPTSCCTPTRAAPWPR
jgi:hypothetical protein